MELIAEILASYGWDIRLTPSTHDGGYDLFAITKDISGKVKTSWLIECKKYGPNNKVGIDLVRGLFHIKMEMKAANVMLATTSWFSRDVHLFKASRYDLELKDYEGILEWINEYHPNPDGKLYIKDHQLKLPEKK